MRPGQDDSISSKVVRRWYYDGKGYASKRAAYKAKAKQLLIEMVLGPWIEETTPDGSTQWMTLEWASKQEYVGEEAQKAAFDKRFAEFFPHDAEDGCVQPGCLHDRDSGGECRRSHIEYETGYWEFEFESCKWSQDKWIKAKVAELIRADEAAASPSEGEKR